jgi:NADH-quinone oxidoreductase subunit G
VLLPIAPFTETAGAFVNAEGRVQSFSGVVRPLGETRPAWKVLRVLGNLLGLPGFEFESAEQVRTAALGNEAALAARLCNEAGAVPSALPAATPGGWQRLADVPIYSADALVRRAPSLQATADARPPQASVGAALWATLGLQPGDRLRVRQGAGSVELPARLDATMAEGTVRVPAGHADTCVLGAASGCVELERVSQAAGVQA